MTAHFRLLPLFSLIALHLSMWVVQDTGHIEVGSSTGAFSHRMVSHDCGSKERHKSLDVKHTCALCQRSNSQFESASIVINLADTNFQSFPTLTAEEQLSSGFSLCGAERGPPFLVS